MGLKNAPIQFQQMMDDLLGELRDICDVYLDDIIISSRMVEGEELLVTHDRDIRRVLDTLRKYHLIADLTKCYFFSARS